MLRSKSSHHSVGVTADSCEGVFNMLAPNLDRSKIHACQDACQQKKLPIDRRKHGRVDVCATILDRSKMGLLFGGDSEPCFVKAVSE